MRILLVSILLVVLGACSGFTQADSIHYDKFIFRYIPDREGIQTAGGDSTFTYSIFNQDGLGVKSGRMETTFIYLPLDSFPPGEYQILFRAKYRYINKKFIIREP